jgi:hypothetical protein
MSSAPPLDMTAASIIGRLDAGEYPLEVVSTIAAGFLPLPQDELIAVLAFLATRGEESVRGTARTSLADVPARSLAAFAQNESAPGEHLDMLVRASEDQVVLELLIRNRTVSDDAVIELARRADAHIQEVIAINHSRLLRSPHILDALDANPDLTADVRRRVLETREEFFEKKARQQPPTPPDDEDAVFDALPLDDIQDLLDRAAAAEEGAAPAAAPELTPAEQGDPKKESVFSKILTMSVSEKVQLAFKGGKTERMLLVRERNRLICSAVMRNPRMNDTEVESIASMRNVDDEVLRLISMKREWMAKYNILVTLVRNPKCPLGIVLPLINRLTLRDLKGLKDDKGVPEGVRVLARKTFNQRSQKS